METEKRTLMFLCILPMVFLMMANSYSASVIDDGHHNKQRRRLFVFGDSYADTGNLPKLFSPSWSEPYGVTFPGKPSGRFSDGRVFTDFLASFLKIRSPIPHKFRRFGLKLIRYGMNFATGGSGVFDTGIFQNNLTIQIDALVDQIHEGVFSKLDLGGSIAVVSIEGNDYTRYMDQGGSMEGLKEFTPKLIEKMKSEAKRVHDLGIGKVAVTNLHPIGCVPSITSSSTYKGCNETVNLAVVFHNQLLAEAVEDLNRGINATAFVTIDLFQAFTSVLNQELKKTGNALKPCCETTSSEYRCGGVDLNGGKQYTVCEDRESAFYWDSVHPSQAGWGAVFSVLNPSLVGTLLQ